MHVSVCASILKQYFLLFYVFGFFLEGGVGGISGILYSSGIKWSDNDCWIYQIKTASSRQLCKQYFSRCTDTKLGIMTSGC